MALRLKPICVGTEPKNAPAMLAKPKARSSLRAFGAAPSHRARAPPPRGFRSAANQLVCFALRGQRNHDGMQQRCPKVSRQHLDGPRFVVLVFFLLCSLFLFGFCVYLCCVLLSVVVSCFCFMIDVVFPCCVVLLLFLLFFLFFYPCFLLFLLVCPSLLLFLLCVLIFPLAVRLCSCCIFFVSLCCYYCCSCFALACVLIYCSSVSYSVFPMDPTEKARNHLLCNNKRLHRRFERGHWCAKAELTQAGNLCIAASVRDWRTTSSSNKSFHLSVHRTRLLLLRRDYSNQLMKLEVGGCLLWGN